MPNLLSLFRREHRAEYEENRAEQAVLAHPGSRVALEALLACSEAEMRAQAQRDERIRRFLDDLVDSATTPSEGT